MAFAPYQNIVGSDGIHVELLAPGDDVDIKSIMLTNIHATADATVSLSIVKLSAGASTSSAQETYYIIHTVAIPADTSLYLDQSDILSFDNSASGYSLYITVGSSDTVDVLIKNRI